MKLPNTLRSGKLIRRYKRFFADIEYENNRVGATFRIVLPMRNQ